MVPQTLLGLFLFLVVLGPGYLYVRRSEQVRPTFSHSIFRETVAVIAASVACTGASLVLFFFIRVAFPSITPDIGAIVRDSETYFRSEYDLVGYYGLGFYLVALAIAFAASHPAVRFSRLVQSPRLATIMGRAPIVPESSWTTLFTFRPECSKRVACRLTDGSWIDGWLLTWNVQPEETDERSLVLTAPIRFRGPDGRVPKILPGVQYSTVSAGQISRLDVINVVESDVQRYNSS
jgi:Family of unknown function (DUF6338)